MRQNRLVKRDYPIPDFSREAAFICQGYRLVAGVDEAGRGCLAGPLVAAAVIIDPVVLPSWIDEVRDSKLLTRSQRERLCILIEKTALATGLGTVSTQIIDQYGMTYSTQLAMSRAVLSLSPSPEALLIDFFKIPELPLPQKGIIGGDRKCLSIACASIVAKVKRDQMMDELDVAYPGYGFCRNKGYATREHLRYLKEAGASPVHRLSFAPVKAVLK